MPNIVLSFAKPTILLAVALMAIIVMMILPVPAFILDVGLALSFALAILIFTITLFIERPLDFSAFPTILLASLMLRLSLNVSSTKLIIGNGHTGTDAAGHVIQGFADFIMNGSVFLGLVVFGILLIVNFMVITKGAARMAEVGARFALDGMPGKQLAIDSDMSVGAISHEEARSRREKEQLETTFFGSLDGASKFVKGDAVAGLLITLLNILVGLAMGVFVHDMPIGMAFETYSILTVGDGLVTQIPAVIISIAAGLLLARGGAVGATDATVFSQLGRHPAALATVAALMFLFALVPGLPFVPFVAGSILLGFVAFRLAGRYTEENEDAVEVTTPIQKEQPLGDVLDLDDVHIEFSPELVDMVLDPTSGIELRINNMRTYIARSYGLIMPEIRLTDDATLPEGMYRIRLHGVEIAKGTLHPDKVLALLPEDPSIVPAGMDVAEPVYGAAARWLNHNQREDVELNGTTVIAPTEVLATHLLEIVKRNLGRLLTMKSLKRLLDEMCTLSNPKKSDENKNLIDELIPEKVQLGVLLQVLKLLLQEQVSIRNLPLVLEAMGEIAGAAQPPDQICEYVRQKLGFQITSGFAREDGKLPIVNIDPTWEVLITDSRTQKGATDADARGSQEFLVKLTDKLVELFSKLAAEGTKAVLLARSTDRRFLRDLLASKGISTPVISYEELTVESPITFVGKIQP